MSRAMNTFDDGEPNAVASSRAGFGALETGRGRLPLVAMDVRTRITDLIAEVTLVQTFRNSLDEPLEATYIFPLPDRSAVTRFQMRVAGRTIEGDLKERGAAREEYDRAIQQGHRAAIAEEDRSGVFYLRVGNIPPGEVATVELTLVGPLAVSDGEATFRFPLVVAPRYTPGVPLDGPSVGSGVTPDTDQVPDASRVTPPVLLPGFANLIRLSLEVQLDSGGVAASQATWRDQVKSSLHSTIADDGPPWSIRLKPAERLNRDFILRFPVAAESVVSSLRVSPAAGGKPGVFALSLAPPALAGAKPKPRKIVFLLDRSGSMGGWKIVAARRALGRMIDTLLDQDQFTVLAFDDVVDRPTHAKDRFVAGTDRERWEMLQWLGGIQARGGTEMGLAIGESLKLLSADLAECAGRNRATNQATGRWTAPSHQPILVIVTDGQVTDEDAILRRIGSAGRPRIFTVGIDRAVNAAFLQRLADGGQGNCELVESEDRLDEAMDRIHRQIGAPVLTQVRLEPVNAAWVSDSLAPKRLPDLFADRPVVIYGRHLSVDETIQLRIHAMDAAGNAWRGEVIGRAGPAPLLIGAWGRAMVRDLEDDYASGATRDATKLMQRIVDVSLESHVLSRFTAYVAVDRAEVVNQGGQLQSIVQPVEMPEAWVMAAPAASLCPPPSMSRSMTRSPMMDQISGCLPVDSTSCEDVDVNYDDDVMGPVDSMLEEFTDTAIDFSESGSSQDSGAFNEDNQPIARLVQLILAEAVQQGATEIRIEPLADRISIQFRVQDKLVDRDNPPRRLLNSIVNRIITLAQLNLAQPHLPQQGELSFEINCVTYVWTVTITKSAFGMSVVLTLNPMGAKDEKGEKKGKPSRKGFWK